MSVDCFFVTHCATAIVRETLDELWGKAQLAIQAVLGWGRVGEDIIVPTLTLTLRVQRNHTGFPTLFYSRLRDDDVPHAGRFGSDDLSF